MRRSSIDVRKNKPVSSPSAPRRASDASAGVSAAAAKGLASKAAAAAAAAAAAKETKSVTTAATAATAPLSPKPPLPPRQGGEIQIVRCSLRAGPTASLPIMVSSSAVSSQLQNGLSPKKMEADVSEPVLSKFQEELLNLLECPVCFMAMSAPIEQCCNGHSVCATCRQRAKCCPECRGEWTGARCRRLEDISERFVARPCRYAALNCPQRFLGAELLQHEKSCPYRSTNCKICGETVSLKELLQHVNRRHKGNIAANGKARTVHVARADAFSFFIVEAFGELFWLWRRNSALFVCVGVDALIDSEQLQGFRVDIEVENADKQCAQQWAGPVHDAADHKQRNAFKPCVKCMMATSALIKEGTRYTVNITRDK